MIVVLCPTRGRPDAAFEMAKSFRETAALFSTELILVIDRDELARGAYELIPSLTNTSSSELLPPNPVRVMVVKGGSLTEATNEAAKRVWNDDCIIGHVGDDHKFVTPGWDKTVTQVLDKPGVAYGNDLLQGPVLPTAVFMSSVIPRTLGWFALPGTRHMKIDTVWKDLGVKTGTLRYLPNVIIEHLHPSVGKSPEDEGYERARQSRRDDARAYKRWLATSDDDIQKLIEEMK